MNQYLNLFKSILSNTRDYLRVCECGRRLIDPYHPSIHPFIHIWMPIDALNGQMKCNLTMVQVR